jgi:hypothetical protein
VEYQSQHTSDQSTRELLVLWLSYLRQARGKNDALAEQAAMTSLLVILRDGYGLTLSREVRASGERWVFYAPWGTGYAETQSDALLNAGDLALWGPIQSYSPVIRLE